MQYSATAHFALISTANDKEIFSGSAEDVAKRGSPGWFRLVWCWRSIHLLRRLLSLRWGRDFGEVMRRRNGMLGGASEPLGQATG